MFRSFQLLQELWSFIKNPVYKEDENPDFRYRLNIVFSLVVIALIMSIILGAIIGGLESAFTLDFGQHAIEGALEKYPPWFLALAAVVLAPLLEELIFRGPMAFFKHKPYFKYVFYGLTLIFGFYHITNFEISTTILLLSPILVAPQISVGTLLGFIRVRFGLWWSILLHALYNLLLIGPILALQILDIPIE
jgi:membrane protease YdiL (CAAX protease family)